MGDFATRSVFLRIFSIRLRYQTSTRPGIVFSIANIHDCRCLYICSYFIFSVLIIKNRFYQSFEPFFYCLQQLQECAFNHALLLDFSLSKYTASLLKFCYGTCLSRSTRYIHKCKTFTNNNTLNWFMVICNILANCS